MIKRDGESLAVCVAVTVQSSACAVWPYVVGLAIRMQFIRCQQLGSVSVGRLGKSFMVRAWLPVRQGALLCDLRTPSSAQVQLSCSLFNAAFVRAQKLEQQKQAGLCLRLALGMTHTHVSARRQNETCCAIPVAQIQLISLAPGHDVYCAVPAPRPKKLARCHTRRAT